MKSAYACNVVIDLEFTPVPKGQRKGGLRCEIIEVGAVKLTPDGEVAGEFSHMVKPTIAHGVSSKVQRMTGIGDEDLTCARPLGEVLQALAAWIGPGKARMVTWSDSDLDQITRECAVKGIDIALPKRWLDIQKLYPRLTGMANRRRRIALGDAADWCGIANEKAYAHRALYDAQMTAELFCMMAAGEFAEHQKRVAAELERPREDAVCTASIADRCGGLADLLASMRAAEAA
ncbi:MAG: exonuclease domain-containing protein [Atopobiaceae bacterium]|nr:exonuclease domain-containing protein [Atopobiaceae bacterium]